MQSRKHSLIETVVNVGIGWVTALILQILVFPMFGINVPFSTNIAISLIFTAFAILRGYVIRRYFNKKLSQFYHKFDASDAIEGELAYRTSDSMLVYGVRNDNGEVTWEPIKVKSFSDEFTIAPISVKMI